MNLTALSSHQFRQLASLKEQFDAIVSGTHQTNGHVPARRGRGPWTPAQRRKFKRTMAERSKA